MLILLPPSEGKTAPRRGAPLDLEALYLPALAEAREAVIDTLVEVSARDDATRLLKVSPGLADVVRANTGLRTAPAARAAQIYTGVLYDALDVASLDSAARRRAARRILVFSALLGPIRLTDRIPAYRLSGSVTLPGLGPLASYWRSRLQDAIDPRGLVIDCRSSAYAAMWQPPSGRHLPVRVFREAGGERTVVSHMAKHTRGLVARALCEDAADPRRPGDLVELLGAYFASHEVATAAGAPVDVRVELGEGTVDVITS
ncbi:YaaA family protein [Cumulibacter manganitolerans]|uniref:YaaA family protein n=1 Tax=Cumulibacter manganitolerans TaxID=1884992 RepID=UPI001294E075|nr:peroxide stress protein YaaA [Cumulibacter manganitolerans]